MNSLLPLTSIQNIPHHNLTLQTPFALKKNLPPHHLPAKRIPLAKCLNAKPKIFYSLTLRLASVCTIIRQTKDVLILMILIVVKKLWHHACWTRSMMASNHQFANVSAQKLTIAHLKNSTKLLAHAEHAI
jgi:hypothetical protein